jgi:hypothetical protein
MRERLGSGIREMILYSRGKKGCIHVAVSNIICKK